MKNRLITALLEVAGIRAFAGTVGLDFDLGFDCGWPSVKSDLKSHSLP
jgi:hypothetical protein